MNTGVRVLGLIPARGGSKGILNKNLIKLCGRPLIAYPCRQARLTKLVDETLITTDSQEIVRTAEEYGIRAPFLRPAELSQDKSLVIDAILHALDWLKKNEGKEFDLVCLMQPTAPLALAEDYDAAVQLAVGRNSDTVITVYSCGVHHPAMMYRLTAEGEAMSYEEPSPIKQMRRRQDLPDVYIRCGITYVFRTELLRSKRTLYGDRIHALVVPEERGSMDINEPLDLVKAEAVMTHLGLG